MGGAQPTRSRHGGRHEVDGEPPEAIATVSALAGRSAAARPGRRSRRVRTIAWLTALGGDPRDRGAGSRGSTSASSVVRRRDRAAVGARHRPRRRCAHRPGAHLPRRPARAAASTAPGSSRRRSSPSPSRSTCSRSIRSPRSTRRLLLVLLVAYRHRFRAPADPPSALRLLRAVPLYLVIVYGFGIVALLLERDRVDPALTLGGMLETITLGLVGIIGPVHLREPLLRRLLPGRAPRARHLRRWSAALAAPRPLTARAPHRSGRLGARPSTSSGPTAGTRSPTSRCATTRASSSPPTARR